MRQLQDHETPITFEFSGLPDRKHPTASFTPVFSPSKIRPFVARVLPTQADRDGVMRQRVCPVSGQVLGTRGPIVKSYLADFPLYLSGEDCIAAVEQSAGKILAASGSVNLAGKDRRINNCRNVAFRSAKERGFRRAKGDTFIHANFKRKRASGVWAGDLVVDFPCHEPRRCGEQLFLQFRGLLGFRLDDHEAAPLARANQQ